MKLFFSYYGKEAKTGGCDGIGEGSASESAKPTILWAFVDVNLSKLIY